MCAVDVIALVINLDVIRFKEIRAKWNGDCSAITNGRSGCTVCMYTMVTSGSE